MTMADLLIKHVTFPIFAYREGLRGIMKDMRFLEQSQFWPRERIFELQQSRLKKLLIHAYENTSFYKKRFDDAGFDKFDSQYILKHFILWE